MVCLFVSISQTVVLINNYCKYETVRKIGEKYIDDVMHTPDIIICRDPPNDSNTENLIDGDISLIDHHDYHEKDHDDENGTNVHVKKLKTLYKGTCDLIESFGLVGETKLKFNTLVTNEIREVQVQASNH